MSRLDTFTQTILRMALVAALGLPTALADSREASGDPYWNRGLAASIPASPDADGRLAILTPRSIPPPILAPEIDLGFSRVRTRFDEFDLTVTAITGGLTYSVFGFAVVEASNAPVFGETFPAEPPFPFSLGLPSESNPAGGALSWAGTLVGTDASGSGLHGSVILGDVEIGISDFLNPRAEIAFYNLFDLDAKSSLDPMKWSDVAVENGAFLVGTEGNRVVGRFYGPEHQEVGGAFERDGIVGAFGAQREQATALPVPESGSADLTEPTEFLALLSRTLLTGDFTFGAGGRSSLPEPGLGPPAAFTELGELQSLAGEASLDFESTTVGLRGSLQLDGMRNGEIEWLSKVGIGDQDFELELEFEITGLFSWLDKGGAFIGENRISFLGGIEGIPFPEINATYQVLAGRSVLVSPFLADAQWSGSMIGKDISASRTSGNAIRGDATLKLTVAYLTQPTLDIEFTNVLDIDDGRPRADITWTAVPVDRGVFRSDQDGDMIEGLFVGLPNEEAVGIFERDDVLGAFSVVRSESSGTEPDAPAPSFEVLAHLDTLDLESAGNAVAAVAEDPDLFSNALASATPTHSTLYGIELTEARALQIPVGQEAANIEVFGGWLEHGFFAVMGIQSGPLDAPDPPRSSVAATLGYITGLNPPSGRARWAGAMLGIDVSGSETHGNRVRGVASITFEDLHYANVDVVFTEVVDLSRNSRRSDMKWWGIPLSAGAFEASVGNHRVSGQFFGPQHEEVAGTFQWHDILGAFGAKRMQP